MATILDDKNQPVTINDSKLWQWLGDADPNMSVTTLGPDGSQKQLKASDLHLALTPAAIRGSKAKGDTQPLPNTLAGNTTRAFANNPFALATSLMAGGPKEAGNALLDQLKGAGQSIVNFPGDLWHDIQHPENWQKAVTDLGIGALTGRALVPGGRAPGPMPEAGPGGPGAGLMLPAPSSLELPNQGMPSLNPATLKQAAGAVWDAKTKPWQTVINMLPKRKPEPGPQAAPTLNRMQILAAKLGIDTTKPLSAEDATRLDEAAHPPKAQKPAPPPKAAPSGPPTGGAPMGTSGAPLMPPPTLPATPPSTPIGGGAFGTSGTPAMPPLPEPAAPNTGVPVGGGPFGVANGSPLPPAPATAPAPNLGVPIGAGQTGAVGWSVPAAEPTGATAQTLSGGDTNIVKSKQTTAAPAKTGTPTPAPKVKDTLSTPPADVTTQLEHSLAQQYNLKINGGGMTKTGALADMKAKGLDADAIDRVAQLLVDRHRN